jgi:hypothetical protein
MLHIFYELCDLLNWPGVLADALYMLVDFSKEAWHCIGGVLVCVYTSDMYFICQNDGGCGKVGGGSGADAGGLAAVLNSKSADIKRPSQAK